MNQEEKLLQLRSSEFSLTHFSLATSLQKKLSFPLSISSVTVTKSDRPKLCGNCAFPQNFHTRKLGENTVFYAVRF